MKKGVVGGFLSVLLVLSSQGCANFRRLDRDLEAYENLASLTVRVAAPEWSGRPLLLVTMTPAKQPGMPYIVDRIATLKGPGKTELRLVPGQYVLGVYEDRSGDAKLQLGEEPVAVYRDLTPFSVGGPDDVQELSLTLSLEAPESLARLARAGAVPDHSHMKLHEGTIAPLSDPRFDPSRAHVGIWEPLRFVKEYGSGLFMLQPYDPSRIPVLFVHGMGGHPREFQAIIDALDRERFQPWVVYYPSGFRLELLANSVATMLQNLKLRLGFEKMFLVAHSMGGLVSRAALSLHAERETPPFITRFVTISSPLGGIASADKGVEKAPSVVPSWRDLGPRSDFIEHLYDKPLPAGLRYTMLFGYGEGASDGVVPVSSQLRHEAQLEAESESGYEDSHVGILSDENAIRAVMRALMAPARGEPAACEGSQS